MADTSAGQRTDGRPTMSPGRLWLWWVLASTAGWFVGGHVGGVLGSSWSPANAGGVVVAAGAGAAAVAQWWVLRRRPGHASWWVPASLAAVAVVAALVLAVDAIDAGVGVALGGAALGVLQWPVLRRQVDRSGWWVPASIVGWIVGGVLSGGVGPPVGWAVIGAVYGAITGLTLVWLFRRSGDRDVTRRSPV